MKKNQDRKNAEKVFLKDSGRITNKEMAKKLGVHPATIARWKKVDEWDLKLIQNITDKNHSQPEEKDFLEIDMRHLNMLNDRIEAHLERKELLPSEILELSQAKLNIISCIEILNEQFRYFDIKENELHEDPEFD
ncbi:MAG: phage terminase small subunit-related protein [Deltaproteobacteria bacterium]|nr:phage terminase small subunit-related protein [Deltaproteobacteria bacterium]